MSSVNPLRQLQDLNRSSVEFPNQLANVLVMEDCMDQAQGLQNADLEKFVEDLDNGLNVLSPASNGFYHCLSELRRICGSRNVLPASHLLSCALTDVGDDPLTSGILADIHEGTFKGVKVCVKRVRIYSKGDPKKLKLFYHEAVVWKRICHPNIVPFHGVTLDPPQLVSDWMEAGNLKKFLSKRPGANRLGLLYDVAEALNYLHSRNVVHGGVKGANILVDDLGRARVTDFSLATIHPSQGPTYGVSEIRDHNPRWTAPEVLEETGSLTEKADVFSFAMLTIEVFTGTVPFYTFQSVASIIKIIEGERPPRPADPTLPDDVWELTQKCWDQKQRSRPEMKTVLQSLAPSLLRSLYQFPKSSLEFQVALNQFYDSTERKGCIDRLHGAELKEFVNFLDDVLRVGGLHEELQQRTLHNLWEVCGERAILPESCMISCQFSHSTAEPCIPSRYAEVRKAQTSPREGSGGAMDVCIKVIELEKVHKEFRGDVALWAKLKHPNILQCFGVSVDHPQIAMEWMPNGSAMEYVQEHKHTDCVCLLIDVAHGLDYLHSHGVIHGNLKQQNILVNSAGRACLSDIGFAKLTPTGGSGPGFDWAQVGAEGCRWAAPEVFKNGKFTKQSDIFSYGFVAVEIFMGQFLWERIDTMEVRSKILKDERPSRPESEKKHSLTTELWRMFALCWGKDPGSRVSASEVLNLLQHLPPQRSGPCNLKTVTLQGEDQANQERIDKLDEMLDASMVYDKERPELLNDLCKMCDIQRSLPKSMVITCLQNVPHIAECGGGSAAVYRGEHRGRQVAIKFLRLYVTSDRDFFLSRFCREAVAWRHLRHPNILPLLGATLEEEEEPRLRFALVSEWMDNGNINSFVKDREDVNRVQLLVDVAFGLEYLHGLNFAHGDLKGANILINNNNRACLADFGLSTICMVARISDDISVSTEVSRISVDSKMSLMPYVSGGTHRWTSPELLDPDSFGVIGDRPTKKSDIYALGMVVYEVLCGKPPYSDRKGNVIHAVLNGVRPSKPDAAAALGFTDELWWTVQCCWLTDRRMRPDVKTVLSRLTHAAWAWDMRR